MNWIWDGKPSLGMSVNGVLAGLVAITAPVRVRDGQCVAAHRRCSRASSSSFAVKLLDTLKIDDPVGAVPVHLFNGVFGTLCVGLFAVDKITGAATGNGLFYGGGMTLLMAQLKGIVAVARLHAGGVARSSGSSSSAVMGLRVSKEEEIEGLDIGEHGEEAYVGFAPRMPARDRRSRLRVFLNWPAALVAPPVTAYWRIT